MLMKIFAEGEGIVGEGGGILLYTAFLKISNKKYQLRAQPLPRAGY
jgi:hypothetical protein